MGAISMILSSKPTKKKMLNGSTWHFLIVMDTLSLLKSWYQALSSAQKKNKKKEKSMVFLPYCVRQ